MKYLFYLFIVLSPITTIANNYFNDSSIRTSYCPTNITVGNDCIYTDKIAIIPDVVYGFSIDGELSISQDDFFVRVLVKEKNGKEHLVMESYREIQGNVPTRFEDYCEETFLTDGMNLDSIKVSTCGVSLRINGIRYLSDIRALRSNKDVEILAKDNRDRIIMTNVEKINAYNETHHLLWRADKTWLSQQSYETKKRILGLKENHSSRGIEYYAGGIVEIDEMDEIVPPLRTDTPYVENFDWRNRHGKNWMTSVKHQGNSGYCYFFTCAGTVEAMTNLYYNQKLDLSLSVQELACCSNVPNPYYGISSDNMERPLNYLIYHGVCDSLSYPFVDFPNQPCLSGSITPIEQIKISNYVEVDITNENEIKKAIINHGPLVSGIHSIAWPINHAMVLVGYGILQAGDTIYHHLGYNYDTGTYFHDRYLTVDENDPRIGRTFLIYKNSYGLTDNDSNLGYMYIIHNNYGTSLNRTFYLTTPFTSLNYTSSDVILEDADGDGYYFWGLGPKPLNCPSWIPNEPDGDDSDYQYGPMDTYGNLEDLELRGLQTLQITYNFTYTSPTFWYTNICVCSSYRLTLESSITMYGNTKITVESGGELVIDGGLLKNADIDLKVGSKITLKNGGAIIIRDGKNFLVPTGASMIIEEGMLN